MRPSPVLNHNPSASSIEWATPWPFFHELDAEFHFTLDVCASDENAKCARYFTIKDNALTQPWIGTCWMNPPYTREISRWMAKAVETAYQGSTVVCLICARTDTHWWHRYAMLGEIRFINGRLKFNQADYAPFPCAIVVFGPSAQPGLGRSYLVRIPRKKH